MHRLHDIIGLIPDESNYLIDTLLEWQFGKLGLSYLKDFIKGDRSKFENVQELCDFLQDPYCKFIGDTPMSLSELFELHPFGIINDLHSIVYGQSTSRSN